MDTVPATLDILDQETDVALVLLMGAAESCAEDKQLAREALRELHSRHYGYVLTLVDRYSEYRGTVVVDPQAFALETFRKAYRSASRFRDKSNGNSERGTAQVKAWLGRIAQNLARDELKRLSRPKHRVDIVPFDESRDGDEDAGGNGNEPATSPFDPEPTEPERLRAVDEALAQLKPEERDIVVTYVTDGIPTSTGGRELPVDAREALEQRTGYERTNIRQKWRRLSERLRTILEPLVAYPKSSTPHAQP